MSDVDTSKTTAKRHAFRVADWRVEPALCRLRRGDEEVRVEPKVMDVLLYLADRSGQVVTREELEAAVWAGMVVSYDALTGTMLKLRKAFRDDPKNPQIIETVSKKGYRLIAPIQSAGDSNPAAELSSPSTATAPKRFWRLQTRWVAFAAILLVTAAVLAALNPWVGSEQGADRKAPGSSIAVIPFDNLSGDPEQDYFADGVTDDLITGLAKIPDLLVIARDSTFFYKGQPLDVREVADKLNVRFLLRGSVRRVGQQVRINAQLIDAETGSHLWAEHYDGKMNNIFELQEEISRKIVSALATRVSIGERQDLGQPLTNNSQAYDFFLYGRQRFYLYLNKNENSKAREFFEKAIDSDPDFAMAYAMLGWTHVFDSMNGWSDDRVRSLHRGHDLATKAISLEKALPVAYFVTGLTYREQGEYVKALVEAEKAIKYDANYANAHVLLATLLYYAGRPEEGLERIQKAMQLNPHHPYNYTFHLGQAYFILGRYEEAIEAFKKGLETNPASERLHVWLAAAYAQAGNIDEAKWEIEQVKTANPQFSLERIQRAFPFKDPADLEHFVSSLRKAGLTS